MKINEYLERIAYKGSLNPDLEVLQALQKRHLFHIPFENLEIHYGGPILLKKDLIFDKIVKRGRGGFCYEMNGLYYFLLKEIGFEVRRVEGRVFSTRRKEYGLPFDHLTIIVTVEEQEYLCDVGYGEFSIHPLPIVFDEIIPDQRGDFKMIRKEPFIKVFKKGKDNWLPEYIFTEATQSWEAFEEMCNYHQSNPESTFTQKKLITQATENGRITLTGKKLKIKEGQDLEEFNIDNEAVFKKTLLDNFKVTI